MNRHTSDAAVESSHLTGVRRRVSSGSSSSFDKDATTSRTTRLRDVLLFCRPPWLESITRWKAFPGAPLCVAKAFSLDMRDATFRHRFDTTLIRLCQTHLVTFFCSSSAHRARQQQRVWDIQNRRHIRAPQREEVTDDGTDYEVHFVKAARYAIRDVDAMRRLSLSLSLSCFFFSTPRAPPRTPPSRSVVVVSFLFALFSLSLSLFPRGVIGLVYHY